MIRESQIMYENAKSPGFYVLKEKSGYHALRPSNGNTTADIDSTYAITPDGLSLAKARVDYMALQWRNKTNPARAALSRAVDKAIAEGAPIYVNQQKGN